MLAIGLCGYLWIGCDDAPRCDPSINRAVALCAEDTVSCRPYALRAPDPAGGSQDLLIYLHDYGASGTANPEHLGLEASAAERGWLLASPTGTNDEPGCNIWNIEGYGNGRDDVAYVDAIIADIEARYTLGRVMVIGHGMGGTLAFRYACEKADSIDAFVSLAGVLPASAACQGQPVPALLVMGDQDEAFAGTDTGLGLHRSAQQSINSRAIVNGCTSGPVQTGRVRTVLSSADAEVLVRLYGGCDAETQYWTVLGADRSFGGQEPGAVDSSDMLDFLLDPPRP